MNIQVGIVKVFDSHIELNDETIADLKSLSERVVIFTELQVEAHQGVKPAKVIEAMDAIRLTRSGPIQFKAVPK